MQASIWYALIAMARTRPQREKNVIISLDHLAKCTRAGRRERLRFEK